jgi:hypothetical protein
MSISNEYAQRDEKKGREGVGRAKKTAAFQKQETYIPGNAMQ